MVSYPLTGSYSFGCDGMPTGRSIAPAASPGSPLQSYTYAFDHSTGNLTGRDYQGSITELIREDGTLVQSYSYDPWGRPRDPVTLELYRTDGTTSLGGSAPALLLGRGYTGHEWLLWFALYKCYGLD